MQIWVAPFLAESQTVPPAMVLDDAIERDFARVCVVENQNCPTDCDAG